MLEILIVVLFLLWLTGSFIIPVGTSFIHVLIVMVIVLIVVRLISPRVVR